MKKFLTSVVAVCLLAAAALAGPPPAPPVDVPPQAPSMYPACPCPGLCQCAGGRPCVCGASCGCPDCPTTYEAGFARVMKGEALKLAVGVKAAKGQFQAPTEFAKRFVPGVYDWKLENGQPCVRAPEATRVLSPIIPAAYNPFLLPGECRGRT